MKEREYLEKYWNMTVEQRDGLPEIFGWICRLFGAGHPNCRKRAECCGRAD